MRVLHLLIGLALIGAVSGSAAAQPDPTVSAKAEAGTMSEPVLIDRVVAVVNQRIITSRQVADTAAALMAQDPKADKEQVVIRALDGLLEEALFSEVFRRLGVPVTERDIDQAIAEVKRSNKLSDSDFAQELEKQGMSLANYRRDMAWELARARVVKAVVQPRVRISDEMLRREYEQLTAGHDPKEVKSFEDMKPQLQQRVFEQEIARETRRWLQEVRKQTYVDIRL